MKKYSVYILFTNGLDIQFETNTNVLLQQPVHINGAEMITTEDGTSFNVQHIDKLEVVDIGKGKIGEIIRK